MFPLSFCFCGSVQRWCR